MNKVGIVYWSGTGNTEIMAEAIAQGVKEKGGEALLLQPGEFNVSKFEEFGVVAFGCPSMGAEVLEESEFEPMFSSIESSLGGKKIALFGSYGWGDGEWMRNWVESCENLGANLYDNEGLIINETPTDDDQALCKELGIKLASW